MAFPSIKIQIGADVSRLGRDLKKGESIVGSFGKMAGNVMTGIATAATGAAIAIGVQGVKAAIEDEAAQVKLAKTLENVTKANSAQVKEVENYIEKTTMATGVTDDKLRPSLDRLIRSTKDVTKAQQLQKIALDVSAGTGKDLEAVTNAIAKAYDGNFGALKKLGVPLDESIVKSKNFNKVQEVLAKTFNGQLAASLDTNEGKLRLLNTRWGEMQEQIGFVLLEGLEPLMDWATGPEGQKFLNDFMEAFKDAALSIAKTLPDVLETLKGIGKTASSMGIDFNTLMTPEVMAAGAAWVATPGGPQIKALAALSAYAGVKTGNAANEADASVLEKIGSLATSANPAGFLYGLATNNQDKFNTAGVWNRELARAGLRETNTYAYNYYVNGAVDPQQTAIAVQRSIAKANRMRVGNNNAPATGF